MKNGLFIVLGFACYYWCFSRFESIMLYISRWIPSGLLSYFLTYIIIGTPVFAVTAWLNRRLGVFRGLGLQANIAVAFMAALVFTLPMFIGGFIHLEVATAINIPNLVAQTIFAGFFEELYFRGFLFGQMFRKTRLGFLPAIILCSIIFALGHLYQSQDSGIRLGVFLTTFMGSALFAWLLVEWHFNLWVPVLLHTFMNLAWHLFAVSNNALGTASFNVYRIMTIALAIILTIVFKKRSGEKLVVNRKRLWVQSS